MPRLVSTLTGVVVNVDEVTAAQLGPEWGPEGGKPKPRRSSKNDDE